MTNTDILDARYCTNSPHVITDTLEGEAIAIRLDNGAYYSFDVGGTIVWNLLRRGVAPTELGNSFGGDTDPVREFVVNLLRDGLLRVADADIVPPSLDPGLDLAGQSVSYEHHLEMTNVIGLDPIHDVDPESGWPIGDMRPHEDSGIAGN